MIAEQQRGRPRATAAPIEDDVVGPCRYGEVNIALDMLGTQLKSDRNASADFADTVSESREILDRVEIGKGRR